VQLVDPAFIAFVGQSGHIMPLETDISLESISGMLALTPMSGSTVTSNNASAAMKHAKHRIFSRAIVAI
jgi:hypothetical protein